MRNLILTLFLLFALSGANADTPPPAGMGEAEFWSMRLNTSPIFQFSYNDAISDGVISKDELENLRSIYNDEAKNYEITLDSYKQILMLKNEFNNPEFDRFLRLSFPSNRLTHADADKIIQKYKELSR